MAPLVTKFGHGCYGNNGPRSDNIFPNSEVLFVKPIKYDKHCLLPERKII